jgi:hypothetical protein
MQKLYQHKKNQEYLVLLNIRHDGNGVFKPTDYKRGAKTTLKIICSMKQVEKI